MSTCVTKPLAPATFLALVVRRLALSIPFSVAAMLTGAVSKGAHDFVPDLLGSLGCEKLFHGIAQRPGKPAGCWLGPSGQIVVALPGNPVSALTGLHALVPAILMNGFLFAELADGIVVVAPEIRRIEERGVIPEQIRGGHCRDSAAVWLQ